jgi:N-acyl-D-aspartate/D-glutamate deacylase
MDEFVLKGGLVHRGDGSEPQEIDISVKKGKIIGFLKATKKNSKNVLDVKGSVITPGFVEVNAGAYGSRGIFEDPFGMHWIQKGITSVIIGSDGVTPAPLFARSATFLQSEYPRASNADWQSMREFLSVLERRGTGVNVGTFAGYATLRSAMTEGYGRDLTVGEIESLGRTISESLKGGAFGVSFDLSGLYLNRVSSDEIFRVINATGKFKSVLAFHLRDERRPVESLAEILSFFKAHAVNVEVSHFQPLTEFKDGYLNAASEIEKISADKNIHFDISPRPIARISIHDLFPVWIKENTLRRFAEAMKETHVRERMLEAFAGFEADTLTIAVAPKPLKFLEGKTVKDFAVNRGTSIAEALLTLATLSTMRMEFFSSAVDREALEQLLQNNHSIVTLDYWDAGEGSEPLLEKILSSEKSIEKITGAPARKFGLQERGFLKEGYYADIAVFKDGKPFYVFVNGTAVLEAGILHPELAGRILKNKSEK